MMSHLPSDMIEEILSRVPATSFKRLRSTCKQWNALFKHPRFTKKHFRKAPKESQALMLNEYRVCSMSVNLNSSPPSIGFGLKNYPPNSEEVEIHEVVHCDGLLLCMTMDNRIVVWNPCLGETRWIQPIGYSKYTLGYEKNKSGHIYKILKCWDSNNLIHGRVDECEIYDFGSDSWRVLDGVAFDCYVLSDIGLSLKGNTYWLALDNNNESAFVLSFDFTAERFTRMCVPPSQDVCQMALSVVGEVQLSGLCQSDSNSKMEMWVTNKIDTDTEAAVLKWSKSFTMDIPIRGDFCPFFMSYLVDEEKKVAVCYNENVGESRKKVYIIGEDNECYREIPFGKSTYESGFCPCIINYVPSLVQIQQG